MLKLVNYKRIMSINENQEELYENTNRNNSQLDSKIYEDSPKISIQNISNILINEFTKRYYYLCKSCGNFPIISFISRNKIKYYCDCPDSPKELSIKDVYDLLLDKYEKDFDEKKLEKLKCLFHPDTKYCLYCNDCEKNICNKCMCETENDCEHKNRIDYFNDNIFNKIKYINGKIRLKNKSIIEEENSENYSKGSSDSYITNNNEYINRNVIINTINGNDTNNIIDSNSPINGGCYICP